MTESELRENRSRMGLTQEQLAKHLGVAPNTVTRWESGNRAIPPYLALALRSIESELSKSKKTKI